MSNNNGLIASTDVCATGDSHSNFFVRIGDPIVTPDPLQIISSNGQEVLTLGIDNGGSATITNVGATNDITITAGRNFDVVANQESHTITGGEIYTSASYQHITGDISMTSSGASQYNSATTESHIVGGLLQTTSAGVSVTSTAGETHVVTGNFGVTATGTASVVASGNTTVGGQNLFLNGGSITANGFVTASPPNVSSTNGSGALSVKNGTAGTAPNTSYTFWAEGDVPNTGRTAGNLDLIRINGSGSLPLLNITPAGNLTLEATGAILSAPKIDATAPSPGVIAPTNLTGLSQQNLQPVLWNSTTKEFVIPASPLIRIFRVNTPDATGNPVDIIDPQGNGYSSTEWVCSIAGFQNSSGDRTYNAVTIPYAGGANWKCLYDTAGSGNQVWILAISTTLLGGIQY